jgi:hypothetical protein
VKVQFPRQRIAVSCILMPLHSKISGPSSRISPPRLSIVKLYTRWSNEATLTSLMVCIYSRYLAITITDIKRVVTSAITNSRAGEHEGCTSIQPKH